MLGSCDDESNVSRPDDSCTSNRVNLQPVNHKAVVFVLEDFDKFSSQLLEDLIVSLK